MVNYENKNLKTDIDNNINRVCIFVSSSDNTFDIFDQVSKSYEINWPDCKYKKFVGLNTENTFHDFHGFTPIYSCVSGWRGELLAQINLLDDNFDYIILLLDDFLIQAPVDNQYLDSLLDLAIENNLQYLRLIPLRRTLFSLFLSKIILFVSPQQFQRVNRKLPYYSSLQASVWKRTHLLNLLMAKDIDIWSFENLTPRELHYAICSDPPINYRHVVEKGRWLPYASREFNNIGITFSSRKRGVLSRKFFISLWWGKIKFALFGYSVMKLKLFVKKIHSTRKKPI